MTIDDIKARVMYKQDLAYRVLADPQRGTNEKEVQEAAQRLVKCADILARLADINRRYEEEVSNLAAKVDQI